jgi:hypothetical protein
MRHIYDLSYSFHLSIWNSTLLSNSNFASMGDINSSNPMSFHLYVGTPDYPSGIPDMHKIHDPMISVSWIHISELITELHHPLQHRIIYLQLVAWPSLILPRRTSLQLNSGYQAALMTHVIPTTLQATDWETFLVHTGAVVTIFIFLIKVFLQFWPS